MGRFRVETHALRNQASDLYTRSGEIERTAQAVETIYHHLNLGSADTTRAVERKLVKIEAGLLEQAVRAESLGKALEYIAAQFERTERAVQEFPNGTVSAATVQHEIHSLYTKILRALGLDRAYYRRKQGSPDAAVSKKQEKMMDHYMSDACAALLKTDRYSEETWYKATPKEREEILKSFILDINDIMGTDVDKNVNFVPMTGGTRGYYDPDTNAVYINSAYLDGSRADSYQIMKTMIHEMRHCYQHTAVKNPEKFMVSRETLDAWQKNFEPGGYYSGDDYAKYVQQPIEWDAKNFAKQYSDVEGYTPEYAGSW